MTQKGIGRTLQFGIAKETTRGTPNAAADFYIPFESLSFDEKYENALDEQSIGRIEDSTGQTRSKIWVEGKATLPIEDQSFPLVIYSALGSYTKTTNSDPSNTVFDHTFTVSQSAQHQALTYFLDDPLSGVDYKYGGGAIDSLEIQYELKKFINYQINVMTKAGTVATLTPSTTAQNRFLPQHVTFKTATAYNILSTGTVIALKSLKLKIAKNIEADDILSSTTPADFLNKQFTIEGTLEALWQSEADFKTAALAGTTKALSIDLTNADVTIGTSAHPVLQIKLAKVVFTALTRPLVLNDLVKQTVTFKAHYSTTDSLMVSVLATNTKSLY